jgi:hypothetical protein
MGTGMFNPFPATDHISRARAVATSALNKYYPLFCPLIEFNETAYAMKKGKIVLVNN